MSSNMELAIEFANKVRAQLRHLSSEQIADLTDGLEADIASSLDDGAEIGSAEKYASDLLSAAGLEVTDVISSQSELKRRVEESLRTTTEYVQRLTSGLAPAWWIFRAWVLTQIVGAIVSDSESTRPLLSQWGEMPFLGVVILLVFLVLSIRYGKASQPKFKWLHAVVTVVLIPAGGIYLLEESGQSQVMSTVQQNSSPACEVVDIPNLVGLKVGDARKALQAAGWLPFHYFDQDAMVTLNLVPDGVDVLQQSPSSGSHVLCGNDSVEIVVDLRAQITKPTVLMPGDENVPTTMPNETTTTTAVRPNATTTTKP